MQSTKINKVLQKEEVLNDDFWKSPEKEESGEVQQKDNQDELKPTSFFYFYLIFRK